jgi:hypothetical protein
MKRFYTILILLFAGIAIWSQNTLAQSTGNCAIMKDGVFKYLDIPDTTAFFVIRGTIHTEFHGFAKYQIKSDLKWLSDCRYELVMGSNNVPEFPFQPGDKMIVTITKIADDIIYFSSVVGKEKWEGRLQKIKL